MGIAWIKKFCPSCKKKTRFEFVGTQKITNREIDLFNCEFCHTTKVFGNPRPITAHTATIGSH